MKYYQYKSYFRTNLKDNIAVYFLINNNYYIIHNSAHKYVL